MSKRGQRVTAADLTNELQADPVFVAEMKERERLLAEKVALYRHEQEPIVTELQEKGVKVERLSDLISRSDPYPTAIPILLKHLALPYSDVTKETLARSLAVPDAKYAWPILVAEYLRTPVKQRDGTRSATKSGLAVALAAIATDSVFDDLIALAKNPSNGESRILLLRALRKSRSVVAKQAIEDMSSDPVLEKEILSWRRRR